MDEKPRDWDSPKKRHVSLMVPWATFQAVLALAESDGRTFSQQAVRLIDEAINRRNGGKAR